MTGFEIWILLKLLPFFGILGKFITFFLLISIIGFNLIVSCDSKEILDENFKNFKKFQTPDFKKFKIKINIILSSLLIIFSCFSSLYPSKDEIITIYLIPKITNNEQIIDITNNGLKALSSELKKILNENN